MAKPINPWYSLDQDNHWSQRTKIVVIAIMLLVTVWLVIFFNLIVNAVLTAALLAYLLEPLVRLLTQSSRISRPWAARLILFGSFLLLASIPAALGIMAAGQSQRIMNELAQAVLVYKHWISQPFEIFWFSFHPLLLLDHLGQAAGSVLSDLPEGSFNILSGMTTNLVWGFVVIVSLYYFLIDGPKIKEQIFSYVPTGYQYDMQRLTGELDQIWGVFIRIQLLIFVVLAALMSSGTFLVIWLFRSGLLGFSPLGFILLLVLVYAAAQQVDNLWLRPKLMGQHLRLHPGLVFAGLMAGLVVGGIIVALLIVPLMSTLRVIGRYIYRQLLDLAPWPEDDLVLVSDAGEIMPINSRQVRD